MIFLFYTFFHLESSFQSLDGILMFFENHAESLGGLFESSASLSSFLKLLIKLLGIFSAIARKQGLEGLFIEREFFGKILTAG